MKSTIITVSKSLLLFFLLVINLSAQEERDRKSSEVASLPAFYYDIVNMGKNDSILCKVDVFLQVPFNKVKFVKDQDKFRGEYMLTVTILDENKHVVTERSWTEKMETGSFNETMSKSNFNISRKSFNLKPQVYIFRMGFEDADSKQTFSTESPVTVRDFKADVELSDLIIISSGNPLTGGRIVPNVARIVNTKTSAIQLYFEVFSRESKKVTASFVFQGANSQFFKRKDVEKQLNPGKNQIYYSFDSVSAGSGEYIVTVTLLNDDLNKITSAQKQLSVRLPGLPFIIRDLDKAIEQMQYIAKRSEIDTIKACKTYDEKLARFLAYWKNKDPNEATEENEIFTEYYRRVEFANRNFTHYMEGWRTDMGMVYVILGTPSNIDRHPFDFDSKPYEIWEYYELNKQFIFVDNSGFGDYRLITPLTGDYNRYR